jgi:hypothetical protein
MDYIRAIAELLARHGFRGLSAWPLIMSKSLALLQALSIGLKS